MHLGAILCIVGWVILILGWTLSYYYRDKEYDENYEKGYFVYPSICYGVSFIIFLCNLVFVI